MHLGKDNGGYDVAFPQPVQVEPEQAVFCPYIQSVAAVGNRRYFADSEVGLAVKSVVRLGGFRLCIVAADAVLESNP